MSHTWFPTGKAVLDFHLPVLRDHSGQPGYPWMAWNQFPEKKPFSLNIDSINKLPLGQPVFEHGRSLGVRRFFPDQQLIDEMHVFAAGQGEAFYHDSRCKQTLFKKWEEISSASDKIGTFETDENRLARYRYELFESKRILEQKLGKDKLFLCWPGGSYNPESVAISREAGYIASTLSSREKGVLDVLNGRYKRIPRTSMSANVGYAGQTYGVFRNPNHLISKVEPNFTRSLFMKAEKLIHIVIARVLSQGNIIGK
jgi:hypothetical protein